MGSIYELAFSGRIGSQSGYTRTRKGINLLNDHDNEIKLVPGVVLIPLQIATKLSMTKSESMLEN